MPADYTKLKAEYIRGGVSIRKLAAKHKVSLSQLQKVAAREKWAELRTKTRIRKDAKISNSIAAAQAKEATNFDSVVDELIEVIRKGIKDGSLTNNASSLKQVTGALKDLRDLKTVSEEDVQRIEVIIGSAAEEYSN